MMRLAVMTLLMVNLLASVAVASAIHVRAQSEVLIDNPNRRSLLLTDIADLEQFSDGDLKLLQQISLGNRPRLGENREFSSFALSEILRGYLAKIEAHSHQRVELSIPRRVRIEGVSSGLSLSKIEREIRDHFQQECARVIGVQCQVTVILNKINLPQGVQTWSLQFKQFPRGSFSLPLTYQSPLPTTTWVSGTLQVVADVPTVKRSLNAGERIDPADIVVEKRDVTYNPDAVVDLAELSSANAARSLSAKQILFRGSIARNKALSRGDLIKIVSGTDGWQVSVNGVAQQSGYVGDNVQVLNPLSRKVFTGVVIDKGVVKVQ